MTRVGITLVFEDGENSFTEFVYGNGLVSMDNNFIQELKRQNFKDFIDCRTYIRKVGYREPEGRCNPEVLNEFIVILGDRNGVWIGGSEEQ
jgi:hypothetical protein